MISPKNALQQTKDVVYKSIVSSSRVLYKLHFGRFYSISMILADLKKNKKFNQFFKSPFSKKKYF